MDPFAFFFRHVATLPEVDYPRGRGRDNPRRVGEAPDPGVPCCLQANGPPTRSDTQGRRGSEQPVRIFFRSDPGLIAGDVVTIAGTKYSADGPAYDDSGLAPMLGSIWCVDAMRKD